MKKNTWKLQEMTYKQLKGRKYEVAMLPIGATEVHGLHLPYGCDTLNVEKIADKICEKATRMGAKVILLPTIPYGVEPELMEFSLTMTVTQAALNHLVTDIIHSLEKHKIYKLFILNGHGGNDFKPLMWDLYERTRVYISLASWWHVAGNVRDKIFENEGGHANEMETSTALEFTKDLVHMKDAADGAYNKTRFEATEKGWVWSILPWHCLTKSGGHGDPRKSTAEKGRKYIDVTVERLGKFVKELSDAPMSKRLPFA